MVKLLAGLAAALLFSVFIVATMSYSYALQSTHYQFLETQLGGIGSNGSHSSNYQTSQTAGILGFGDSSSATMQVKNGHQTTADPALSFAVNSSVTNFGSFSPGSTAVATSTFSVSDYTSWGYIVQIIGNPPTNGAHTIAAMSSLGPSQVGVEQYGINLVANTSPTSLGANPDHGQFGFGSAIGNYASTNNYYYASGDTIAQATKSSGVTNYTISHIVNVTDLTPGGDYTSSQVLICVATY